MGKHSNSMHVTACIIAQAVILMESMLLCCLLSAVSVHCELVCSRSILAMQINDNFDSPEIIVQVYPQEQLLEGVLNQNESTTYLQYMSSLYTAAQMEGMMNVHLLQLNAVDMPLTGWCASHPSAAADANIAAQLSAFIEAVLPEWTRTMYPLSVQV